MAAVLTAAIVLAAASAQPPAAPSDAGCRTKRLETGSVTACPRTLAVESDVAPMTREQTTRQLERFAAQFAGVTSVDRGDYRLDGRSLRSATVRGKGLKGPFEARMVVVPAKTGTRLVTCTQERLSGEAETCRRLLEKLVRAAPPRPNRR